MSTIRKRWLWLVIMNLFFLLVMACSSNQIATKQQMTSSSEKDPVITNSLKTSRNKFSNEIKKAEKQDRKITYKATITIDINNYPKSRKLLEQLVEDAQGYLVHGSEEQNQKRLQTGTFTFRIPQKNFQTFINKLKTSSFDGEVRQVTITGEDVTEEMVDLDARLKAKKATESRLLDLMKQTTNHATLLQISQQLDQVQVEIEQIVGRKQYLQHRVDFSEVIITLTQEEVVTAPDNASMWQKMKDTFVKSTKGVINVGKNLLIFLAGSIPILIALSFVLIPLYLFIRYWKKRKRMEEETKSPEDHGTNQ